MNTVRFAVAIVLLSVCAASAEDSAKIPAKVPSIEFLGSTSKWVQATRKIIEPLSKHGKMEQSALSILSGSYESLDVAPVIQELRTFRLALGDTKTNLSAEALQTERDKLARNREIIREFKRALSEIQKDLKTGVGLPLPRVTSAPNKIESWYFFEIPALQRELGNLDISLSLKQRELAMLQPPAASKPEELPFFMAEEAIAALEARRTEAKSLAVIAGNAESLNGTLTKDITQIEAELRDESALLSFLHEQANAIVDEKARAPIRAFEGELRRYISKKAELSYTLRAKRIETEKVLGTVAKAVIPELPPVYVPRTPSGLNRLADVSSYIKNQQEARTQTQAMLLASYRDRLNAHRQANPQTWELAQSYAREFRAIQAGRVHDLQAVLAENKADLEQMLKSAESRAQYGSKRARELSQQRLQEGRQAFLSLAKAEREAWKLSADTTIGEAHKRGWANAQPSGNDATPTDSSRKGQSSVPEAGNKNGSETNNGTESEPPATGEMNPVQNSSDHQLFMRLYAPDPKASQTKPDGQSDSKPEAIIPLFNYRF